MAKALYVGIDLGTTNSAVAVFDGDRVQLVRNAQGGTLTPSVVRIDARGTVTTGARARRFLDTDPDNTRAEFKRLMGTVTRLPFPASGRDRSPEELSAEVLRSLRADVQEQLGVAPTRAVISVPALFELPQSKATAEAARLAGFDQVELIQEPVASALAAGWSADEHAAGAWLVYDLGGGTFDASLLETRDGLLRVVGHDGDNFLGGRDIDGVLVDHALRVLQEAGSTLRRGDPAHAAGFRRLRAAAEEAKIELTRARSTSMVVEGCFTVGGVGVDVDVEVTRSALEALIKPLVDRSLGICRRLLATHGLTPGQLSHVVLVGGPTVMPGLREAVTTALGARIAEGHDPMTLVAQGAALYAASSGLDGRAVAAKVEAGRKLWLHYPSMCSDLFPHVAGRLVEGGTGPMPATVSFVREGWASPPVKLSAQGGLVASLEVLPRRPNTFRVVARDEAGREVPIDPAEIIIVHGMSLSDPPLSRTIAVALASDDVRVYLERGTPLPARRTFEHRTVEAVARGSAETMLRIPIVQGESSFAHLNRLVGTLDIGGQALKAHLPAGATVELTIEVDRGGRLSARALVPSLGLVFEEVAHLVVPDATPEALERRVGELVRRAGTVRGAAMRRGDIGAQDALYDVEWRLADVQASVEAARGGDRDAAQKAQRALTDVEEQLEAMEAEGNWPELDARSRREIAWASALLAQRGTPEERTIAADVIRALEQARAARQQVELERQLRVLRDLGSAAWFRDPQAWFIEFDHAASKVHQAQDLGRATQLVEQGRRARARGDGAEVQNVTQQLWALLPAHDAQTRRLGHDSGVQ